MNFRRFVTWLRNDSRFASPVIRNQCRLKYCTARSCFAAADRVLNVPRFLRRPVAGFRFREYKRYWPDLSFRIIAQPSTGLPLGHLFGSGTLGDHD
jgi:hypothetical protein